MPKAKDGRVASGKKVTLRLPENVRKTILELAIKNRRSLNEQITIMLERSAGGKEVFVLPPDVDESKKDSSLETKSRKVAGN